MFIFIVFLMVYSFDVFLLSREARDISSRFVLVIGKEFFHNY